MRQPNDAKRLVDLHQARYVSGVLGMLIAVVGQRTCLGVVLQQARSEITSLLRSEEFLEDECAAA